MPAIANALPIERLPPQIDNDDRPTGRQNKVTENSIRFSGFLVCISTRKFLLFRRDELSTDEIFHIKLDPPKYHNFTKENIRAQLNEQLRAKEAEKLANFPPDLRSFMGVKIRFADKERKVDSIFDKLKAGLSNIEQVVTTEDIGGPLGSSSSKPNSIKVNFTIKKPYGKMLVDLTRDQIEDLVRNQLREQDITYISDLDLKRVVQNLFNLIREKSAPKNE